MSRSPCSEIRGTPVARLRLAASAGRVTVYVRLERGTERDFLVKMFVDPVCGKMKVVAVLVHEKRRDGRRRADGAKMDEEMASQGKLDGR